MASEPPDLDALDLHHHEVLAALRTKGPVAWLPAVGGWVILSRAMAVEVMRDPDAFTVDDPRFTTAKVVGKSMLSLDGVEHRRHRAPFATAFGSAEMLRRGTAEVSTLARRMVQQLQPRGHAELRRELAGPLAVAVSAGALGLDDQPPATLLGWYDLIVAGVERASRGEEVGVAAKGAFESLANALRSVAARPDSRLGSLGSDLTDDELVSNAAVFLFGGIETSEGMTANVFHHLLTNPEQLAAVRNDDSLIDAAVEESLRLEPAAARVDRYATRDVELGGCQIAAGDFVAVSLAAANRDPDWFHEPDRFDVHRSNARTHLAFAHGPHVCIGSTLARHQTVAAVAAVLELLPGLHLTAPVRTSGVVFRKPVSLPAAWRIEGA